MLVKHIYIIYNKNKKKDSIYLKLNKILDIKYKYTTYYVKICIALEPIHVKKSSLKI
jgi:hypothetical protein